MSNDSRRRAVWLMGWPVEDDEPVPRSIGEASSWDDALIVFADWCHRTEVGNLSDDELQCNGMGVRQRCMDRIAAKLGLEQIPAFTNDWTFTMNKVCPGFCINLGALAR